MDLSRFPASLPLPSTPFACITLWPCQRRTKRQQIRIPPDYNVNMINQVSWARACAWRHACANAPCILSWVCTPCNKICCHCGKYSRIIPYLTIVIRWTYPNMTALYRRDTTNFHPVSPSEGKITEGKLFDSDLCMCVRVEMFEAKSNAVPPSEVSHGKVGL